MANKYGLSAYGIALLAMTWPMMIAWSRRLYVIQNTIFSRTFI